MTSAVQADSVPAKATARQWLGLAVIALPCLLYSMDLTVLNLALPRLSVQLRPSSAQLLWIVDIYGFLVAGFLITMGNLGDRIGRRRLLMLGAAGFGIASVLAAFSNSPTMLIAARALLGVAGATLAPSTLSLIRNMFDDPKQRTMAVGVWIAAYSAGGAIGPLLGGIMLQHFWWGSVFLLGVPVMVLLLLVGPHLLPEYRDRAAAALDFPSVAMSLMAVLAMIYGIKVFAQHGASWLPLSMIAMGGILGAVFIQRQKHLRDPLIDLKLFRVPAFTVSLITFTLSAMVMFGSYVFIGQYLQLVLGLSPLQAGLWTLPWSAGSIVGSLLIPLIARRLRPAVLMAAGLALAVIGFALLTQTHALGLASVVAGSVLYCLGFAPVFTLGTDLIIGAAPPARAGAASAISETSFELGGALGIAILGSIGTAIYRTRMAAARLPGVTAEVRRAAQDTLGGAAAAADLLPAAQGGTLLQTARDAFEHAMHTTVILCVVILLATTILAFVMLRRSSQLARASD